MYHQYFSIDDDLKRILFHCFFVLVVDDGDSIMMFDDGNGLCFVWSFAFHDEFDDGHLYPHTLTMTEGLSISI